jgi:uncharacterized protein (DUF697 family)
MSQQSPFEQTFEAVAKNVQATAQSISNAVDTLVPTVQGWVERSTEALVAENPLIKATSRLPGLRWMAAALGQVNPLDIQRQTDQLRQKYPQESTDQLVQRTIQSATLNAAGVGLATNLLPPMAVALFAIDIAVVATLQAEMLYRIANLYEFAADEPTRRGEVLAIYALSIGGTGVLKTFLSIPEAIPVVGAVVGASSDAALLFGLGQVANQYYAAKRNRRAAS